MHTLCRVYFYIYNVCQDLSFRFGNIHKWCPILFGHFRPPPTVWPESIWKVNTSQLLLPQHQSTYPRGPESASIDDPNLLSKCTSRQWCAISINILTGHLFRYWETWALYNAFLPMPFNKCTPNVEVFYKVW